MSLRTVSLRTRVIVLVSLAIVPGLALIGYSGAAQRDIVAEQAREGVSRLVRVSSRNAEQLVEGARQLLVALASVPQVRDGTSEECGAFLAALLREYEVYANLGVANVDGSLACSALPPTPGIDVSDRKYFRDAVTRRTFSIGDYQIGRITGKASINFGMPILRDDAVVRVVFAALDLEWLEQHMDVADLPDGGVAVVVDGSGTILTRLPEPENWVGKRFPDSRLVRLMTTRREGTARVPGIDGVPRSFAFTALGSGDPAPASLAIGIPESTLFADADAAFRRSIVAMIAFGLIALAAAWLVGDMLIVRRARRLLDATERLAAGDLDARAELDGRRDEIGRLGVAFDEMAAALQAREEQLRRAERRAVEERFRGLLNVAADAIVAVKADGRITLFNRGAEELFGFAAGEVTGQPLGTILPARFADTYVAQIRAFAAAPEGARPITERREIECRRKDGTVFPAEASLSRSVGDGAATFTLIIRDASERQRTHELRARLAAIVEFSDDAIIGKTLEGIVTSWNRGAQLLYGYTPEEIVGRPITTLVPPGRPDEVPEILRRLRNGETIQHFETRRRRKDGVIIDVSLTISPVRDRDGTIIGASTIARDITQQKMAEHALRESEARLQAAYEQERSAASRLRELDELKNEFVGILAHDLRTPMSVIGGFAEVMKLQWESLPDAQKLHFIDVISRNTQTLTDMVEEILQVARIESGDLRFDRALLDLGALVQRAMDEQATMHDARVFEVEVEEDLPPVFADEARVWRVFTNIVSNAVKYSPAGEPVHVTVEREGDGVRVAVRDHGPGIAPDEQPKLFQRFSRLAQPAGGAVKGTGLGLYICRSFVEGQGGRIWVDSRPGEGSTFAFVLPAADREPAR